LEIKGGGGMIKALNERIAEYVAQQIKNGENGVTIAEIQREFAAGYITVRDILDTMPNLIYNKFNGKYIKGGN
jgi:hypothetical protein